MAIEDTATLKASLKTSLILDSGTGNPTFSRVGTINVTNSEGNTLTVPANVAAFEGARLVENIATANSGTFNTGNYEVLNLTITGPNEVTSSASGTNTIRPDNATGHYETYTAGRTYASTYRVQSVEVQFVQLITNVGMMGSQQFVNFDVVNGTVETSSALITGFIEDFGGGEYRCSAVFTAVNTATTANALVLIPAATSAFRAAYGTGGDRLNIFGYMMEDITDKTIAEPSEYVSKGVLAAPFHGAGLDGFKWFDTREDRATPILDSNLKGLRGGTLSYQTASNFNDTNGAIAAIIESDNWASPNGHIGGTTTGLHLSALNSGVQALDGTNTVNGLAGSPTGQIPMAISWTGSSLKAAQNSNPVIGSYDGSFNLSTIEIDIDGTIRDLNIWTTELTDAETAEASGTEPQTGILVNSLIGSLTNNGLNSQALISTVFDTNVSSSNINGFNSNITQGFELNSNIGNSNTIGQNSSISQNIVINTTIGPILTVGQNSDVILENVINTDQGLVSTTGENSTITQGFIFDTSVNNSNIVGQSSNILNPLAINTSVGNTIFQGLKSEIQIPVNLLINSNVGSTLTSGVNSTVGQTTQLNSAIGNIESIGLDSNITLGTLALSQVNDISISGFNSEVINGTNIDVNSQIGLSVLTGQNSFVQLPILFNSQVDSALTTGSDSQIIQSILVDSQAKSLTINSINSTISETLLINSQFSLMQFQGNNAIITFQTTNPLVSSISIEMTIQSPNIEMVLSHEDIDLTL